MTLSLRTAISSGIEYCVQTASEVSSKAGEFVSSVLDEGVKTVSGLLPEMKPASVRELFQQTQEQGSALLRVGYGEVFIEVSKEENGLRIFTADDQQSHKPVVILEREENSAWEEKVTKYLRKHFNKTSMVHLGLTKQRWSKDAFSDLIKYLVFGGLLRKKGEQVTLKLPEEGRITFDNPHADLKAEIFLKHYYHNRKTPIEEVGSETWNHIKRLAMGYLSVSGDVLSPWVKNNVRFSDQSIQKRKKSADQKTAEGFLDSSKLVCDVKKLLEQADIAPTSLHQTMFSAATAYAASMLTSKDSKVATIAGLFTLFPGASALSTDGNREITITNAENSIEERKTDAVAKNALARQTVPITIINPLPDVLFATPGVPLNLPIDMKQYFALSDPNSNLELSIKQSNGTAVPSWLSMNMGDLSLTTTYYFGSDVRDICVSGNYAYVALDNGVKIVDISNPNQPIPVGSYNRDGIGGFISVKGNYAYYGYNLAYTISELNGWIDVLDITNPPNIVRKASVNTNRESKGMTMSGDYIYDAATTAPWNYLIGANITNPLNPTEDGTAVWQNQGVPANCVYVSGNYAYVGDEFLRIFDTSRPGYPVLLTTVNTTSSVSAVHVQGNKLFVAGGAGVAIYDNTDVLNPILIKIVYLGGSATELVFEGNYLYAFCGGNGVKVVNIENVQNAELAATFNTNGQSYDAFFQGNNAFTANGSSGLAIINAAKRILSGTPSSADRGLLQIYVTAADDLGNSVVEPINIHIGNINVALPIPNQQVYVGNSTIFTFAPGTFEFPGATFTYTAKLVGGLPLPSFISFDSSSRTFIFAPKSGDQGTYRIEVTANDGYIDTKTTFDLSVPDRPPVVEQPLSNQTANTGVAFEYIFAGNSFTDLDKDTLAYSARLEDSNVLPGWLGFDPALRRFYGTPFGRNVYPIEVTASDGFGGSATSTFTITVPNSAPIVLNPLGTQLASAGIPFSYTFNTNTFYDVDNDPLTYTATQLPGFLTFNPATRTFSGTPQVTDAGTYHITLQAQDPSGANVSTTFSLTVLSSSNNNPPVLVKSIPDVTEKAGVPFSYSFDAGSFEDPDGDTITYQATLEGGAPLPQGLYFDSDTRTLSGVVQDPQSIRITIRAVDPYGAFAVDTFTLNVLDNTNYPPIVLNPLPDVVATVHQHFFFRIPDDTFADMNNDKLTITINQSGGQPLPKWLRWDPATNSLSGVPGPWDTGTYQDKVIDVEVWASDGHGSVKTTLKIIVQGESFWEMFIKYGISFGSVAASGIGFFKSRALIWNHFMKDKYHKKTERAVIGEQFERKIFLELKKVKEIKVYCNGKSIAKLPNGLVYEDDKLKGIPISKSEGRYTIRVFDQDGYINEEFDLIIKKNVDDPDPKEEKGYIQTTLAALSSTCLPNKAVDEESGKKSLFGSKKGNSSTMMKSLLLEQDK